MKPISVKTIFWTAVTLIALASAYLLVSGTIERLIRSDDPDRSAPAPVVRNRIPAAHKPRPADNSGAKIGSVDPSAGVTRAFFKPLRSESADTVRLEITAVEKNNELVISGKLLDGSACNRLQIELELQADNGRKIFHALILGNVDAAGERPIRSKRRLPPSSDKLPLAWRAHVAAIRCLDP